MLRLFILLVKWMTVKMNRIFFSIWVLLLLFSCNLKNNSHKNTTVSLEDQLIIALDNYEYKKACKIIQLGADKNIIYNKQPLLMYAVSKNLTNFSLFLINDNADVNIMDENENNTLLSLAIYNKNFEIEKAIVEKGVNLNYKNKKNDDYISICIIEKDYKFLSYILLNNEIQKLFEKNKEKYLYQFIYNWNLETSDMIDVMYKENFEVFNKVPVLLIGIDNINVLKFFINKGIDPNKKYFNPDNDEFVTPLEYAYRAEYKYTHYLGTDSKFSDESDEVKNIRKIIKFLKTKTAYPHQ